MTVFEIFMIGKHTHHMTLGSRYINKTFKEENCWILYVRMGEGVWNEPLIDGNVTDYLKR